VIGTSVREADIDEGSVYTGTVPAHPDWTHIKCLCSAIAHARMATYGRDFTAYPLGKHWTGWKEVVVQVGTHLFVS
jgi:hypothetical protein